MFNLNSVCWLEWHLRTKTFECHNLSLLDPIITRYSFLLGNYLALLICKSHLFISYHFLVKSAFGMHGMRGLRVLCYSQWLAHLPGPNYSSLPLTQARLWQEPSLCSRCDFVVLIFFFLTCSGRGMLIIYSGQCRKKKMGTLRKFSSCSFLACQPTHL